MNKAIRFFKVFFFIAVGLKLLHDLGACYYWFDEKGIDFLYGVSNTLFKLAPAYALFILTRKLLGFNRVFIHSAFLLYLADIFDELFFNPYEYGFGEWIMAVIFYYTLNYFYQKK